MAAPLSTIFLVHYVPLHAMDSVNIDFLAEAYARFPTRRPSQGSTTSARSVTTQPNNIDPQQDDIQSFHAAAAWLAQQQHQQHQHQHQQQQHHHQNGQLRQIAPAPRATSPEYVLTNGLPVQSTRDFSVEPPVHNGMGAQFRIQQHQQHQPHSQHMARQSLPAEYMAMNGHHGLGAQMMERNDSPAPDSGLDIGNPPTRSRSNTNNDQEMRELFSRNSHRSLQDVAKELHGNERGPSSERSRQLFAMLW